MRRVIPVFVVLVLAVSQNIFAQKSNKKKTSTPNKKISITFDNLPADRNYEEDIRNQISRDILESFKKHEVKAAGFVVGDNIAGDWKVLVNWLEAGHTLGFMTYSGQDIENVPVDMFISDIAKGKQTIDEILKTYKQKERYFRFPYLHYGSIPESRNKIEGLIKQQKVRIAHVSIVIEDFVYNLSLEKIVNSRDSTKLYRLRDEYLEHILSRLASAETLAMEIVNRPIRHIIQFRANRINAYFMDDILSLLEDKGYKYVSLGHALNDKVYKIYDDYYENQTLSYLERLKYSK
jgi:peptidoglycan/xylan/chitin deacetylase (PgdA/CDA1 family)